MSTVKSLIFLNPKLGNIRNSTEQFTRLNDIAKPVNKNFDDTNIGNQKKLFNLQQYYHNKKKESAEDYKLKKFSEIKIFSDITKNN